MHRQIPIRKIKCFLDVSFMNQYLLGMCEVGEFYKSLFIIYLPLLSRSIYALPKSNSGVTRQLSHFTHLADMD